MGHWQKDGRAESGLMDHVYKTMYSHCQLLAEYTCLTVLKTHFHKTEDNSAKKQLGMCVETTETEGISG